MMNKKKWIYWLVILGLAFGISYCISEDDDDDGGWSMTWDMLARYIDKQLGEIAEGAAPECDGNPVADGTHCKNQLKSALKQGMVANIAALLQDCSWPGYVNTAWRPVAVDLCNADLLPVNGSTIGNGIPDIYEVCTNDGSWPSAGVIECKETGKNQWRLTYEACMYDDTGIPGGCWYELNGVINVLYYFTGRGESVILMGFRQFTAERMAAPTSTYLLNGTEMIYKMIDPFTGQQVIGTTGAPDGMRVLDLVIKVDHDGPAGPAIPGKYLLRMAEDEEDGGMVLFNAEGSGVWMDSSATVITGGTTELTFYDKNFPWNDGGAGGCKVALSNFDVNNRTFDLYSESLYGTMGCLADKTGIKY